jgi:hypothetical protein
MLLTVPAVMARLVRAIHGRFRDVRIAMGRPDKPGDDDFV